MRRSVLTPFFSTQSVRNLQPVVEERVDRLLEALHKFAATKCGTPVDAMYPFSAFTNGMCSGRRKGATCLPFY